ncbi:hypothetical protein ACQPZK_16750 [Micromonospora sp. CA-249363]|uniref:hypothetical protein n=1 Tax=Micromonospora sp. CA-249363 TaxID=3239963 RepID=UPI003D93ACAE
MLSAEAPKITDWMQAWGSLAGLVMSTFAVVFTGLLFRHETRVRREEQASREAAQARLVIPVLTRDDDDSEDEGVVVRRDPTGATVTLVNHSAAPIFDVHVDVAWQESFRWPGRRREVRGTVIANGGRRFAVVEKSEVVRFELTGSAAFVGEARIRFTDAAGLVWQRTGLGSPVRYTPSESPMGRALRLLPWLLLAIYVVLPAIVIAAVVAVVWLWP